MKKKKGQALKVSKDPNAFISPWMCHLFLCQIDSNICKAKKHSGVQVQEDGHEEMLQEATHELFSVQADGGEQGGCPHSRVMQPHVEDFDCCCLKGTCPWLHGPL